MGLVALCAAAAPAVGAVITRSGAPYPEDQKPPGEIADWHSLNRSLMLQGVNLSAVSWNDVNGLCGPAVSDPKAEAYRAYRLCQYRMVIRREAFLGDRALCEDDAERRFNPRAAVLYRPADTVKTVFDRDGKVTATVRESGRSPGIRELRQWRERYVIDCMTGRGWVNPDSWMDGRR